MEDKDIASVSVAGIIEAKKIGKTTLFARSVGRDRHGNSVIFSEVNSNFFFYCINHLLLCIFFA